MERDAARLQFWATVSALGIVGLVVTAIFPWDVRFLYTLGMECVMLVLAFVNYRLALRNRWPRWFGFVTGTLQIALLTVFLIAPNPFADVDLPSAMALREAGFRFLLMLICLGALTLSPAPGSLAGYSPAAVCWAAAVLWIILHVPERCLPSLSLWMGHLAVARALAGSISIRISSTSSTRD